MDYFCKSPQELKQQVYYLLLDNQWAVNMNMPGSASCKKNSSNVMPQQMESTNLKSDFLFFLDKLLEENVIYGKYLKKIYTLGEKKQIKKKFIYPIK